MAVTKQMLKTKPRTLELRLSTKKRASEDALLGKVELPEVLLSRSESFLKLFDLRRAHLAKELLSHAVF